MTTKFEVQHEMIYGWENVWTEGDGELAYFDSYEEAEAELLSFLMDEQRAFEEGNIEEPYTLDQFRIVAVET